MSIFKRMFVKATIFCFLVSTLPHGIFSFKFKKAKEIHLYKKSPHFYHHHHFHHNKGNGNKPNFVATEIPVIPFINTENFKTTEIVEIPTKNPVIVNDVSEVPTNQPITTTTTTTTLNTTVQNEVSEPEVTTTTTPVTFEEITYTYEVTEKIEGDVTTPSYRPTQTTTTTTKTTTNADTTETTEANCTADATTTDATPSTTTTETTTTEKHFEETTLERHIHKPKITKVKITFKTHPDYDDSYFHDHENDFDNKHPHQHTVGNINNHFELNNNIDPAINNLFVNYVNDKNHNQNVPKYPIEQHVENDKEISHVEYNIYKEDHAVRNQKDHDHHHYYRDYHEYHKHDNPKKFHQHTPHSDSYLKIWTK